LKRAVDLFSGTESATKFFDQSPEWQVHTVDIQEQFDPDTCADIRDLTPDDLPDNVDFIWASPPCTNFSIAKCWDHWENTGNDRMVLPDDRATVESVELVYHALYLINKLDPEYWIMENPRGYMRKIMPSRDDSGAQGVITYCQYDYPLMKPTNLWGDIPEDFEFRKCNSAWTQLYPLLTSSLSLSLRSSCATTSPSFTKMNEVSPCLNGESSL